MTVPCIIDLARLQAGFVVFTKTSRKAPSFMTGIIGKAETSKGIQILIQMQGKVKSDYSKSLQSELVSIQNSLSVYGDSTTWEFCDVSYYYAFQIWASST